MSKVKKILKWFIIIVLIAGAVAATVFIFFKKYNENKIDDVDLVSVLNSTERTKFDSGFDAVLSSIEASQKPTWFDEAVIAGENLDKSLKVLSYYYVDSNGIVNDAEIDKTYSSMITTRNTLINMFDEYKVKATSNYFPILLGANDIFVAYSNYLVKYAKFVKAVNEDLLTRENFNVVSDIKFSMIDLYSRIVVDAFSKLTKDVDLAVIGNKVNLIEIHNYFEFENSYIDCDNALKVDAIRFIENYNACNKELFADKFVEFLSKANGIDAESTNEIKTAFYFNQLF